MSRDAELNSQQSNAIRTKEGIVLVIAGAGTGKTKTTTHFIADVIEQGKAKPDEILAVTFTNKAAEEMQARVSEMVGKSPRISTIHSFANDVLCNYPPKEYTKDFKIMDDKEYYFFVADLAKKLGVDKHPSFIIEKLTYARNTRNRKVLSDEGLDAYYERLVSRLIEQNRIDFDGLLTWCLHVLENNSVALRAYRSKYKYIMVDEFQDISLLQYEIIKLIVKGCGNLFCVGDFDQNIYSFRGADVSIILNLHRDFPSLHRHTLEQNYRSTKNIVDAANCLIQNNQKREDKPHWTTRPPGSSVQLEACADDQKEAIYIATRIQAAVASGARYSDFAVLYRVNMLSQSLESNFAAQRIPYQIIGDIRYFQRREVQNILCYFRLAVDPDDRQALYMARTMLRTATAPQVNLQTFVQQLAAQTSLSEIYNEVLSYTGYLIYLMRDESVSGRQKVDNVERLRSVIETFAQVNNSIVEFLTFVGEAKDNKDGDAVKLLTVHAAKGLEFDTVFIAGATDRMMPHYRSKLQNEIEEERRLFYVAMTRAKNNLVITYPRLNGKNTQSPFIAEMRSTSRSLQTQGPLSQLQKGMRIRHPQFGSGKVISIRKDYQDKDQAVIQFSTGLKTLLLEYAPITVE